jgi:hypothetical protein
MLLTHVISETMKQVHLEEQSPGSREIQDGGASMQLLPGAA